MITVRKNNERGHANHGWLDTYHTFSFADYFDRNHMGFRSLRVINEDRVSPAQGFGAHGHDNMEILTYVLEGALAHKDSMGNVETLRAGELQRMSAGTGIIHSEYNASKTEPVHFLQIWLRPGQKNLTPSYEQMKLGPEQKSGRLFVAASPDNGAMKIHQDARVLIGDVSSGSELVHAVEPGRAAWLHVIRGNVAVDGVQLGTGDAAAVTDESRVEIRGKDANSEVLLFDLA
jgi:redox-sensitive bicupin YhaK (pirin superfamily)